MIIIKKGFLKKRGDAMKNQPRSVDDIIDEIRKCDSVHELMTLYTESKNICEDDPDTWIKVLETLVARNDELKDK